jgi:hypothetical protein
MSTLPWIKVWTAIPKHPKVQRLEKELRIKDALGIVLRLWCWTADYHPSGDVPREDLLGAAKEIRADSCRRGAAEVVRGLENCGFVDVIPSGYRIHDWHEMQTKHVEQDERKRSQAAARQAEFRARKAAAESNSNAEVTRDVTRDVTLVTERYLGPKTRQDKTRVDERALQSANGTEGGARLAGDSLTLLDFRQRLSKALGLSGTISIAKPAEVAEVAAYFEGQLKAVGCECLIADCLQAAERGGTTPGSLKWLRGWIEKLHSPSEVTQ